MTPSLVLRPQHDAAGHACGDLAIRLPRLAESAGLFDRRGAIIGGDNSRGGRIQNLRRRRKIALERVHAKKPAFVVIEISEVETHFTPASRGDFRPAFPAPGETLESAAEHHSANQIEDETGAFPSSRR